MFTKIARSHPQWNLTDEYSVEGLTSVYYNGPNWQGEPTKVYAYIGVPAGNPPPGGWPGVVLAHGGRGTAFADWVKQWVARGYAALAMDLEGHLPDLKSVWPHRRRNLQGGPAYPGPLVQFSDLPVADQWPYHAVANIISARSVLSRWPGVAPERIGLIGISWGGLLSLLAASAEPRFRAVVTIYGCGHIPDSDGTLRGDFVSSSASASNLTSLRWDPSSHLDRIKMPTLWVNSTVDPFFPVNVFSLSATQTKNSFYLKLDPGLPHGHVPAWSVPEIAVFMDQELRHHIPKLPCFAASHVGKHSVSFELNTEARVGSATVCYTEDSGLWAKRAWHIQELGFVPKKRSFTLARPTKRTTAFFLTLTLPDGAQSCSPLLQ